jgi:signal transduction histidine kinase
MVWPKYLHPELDMPVESPQKRRVWGLLLLSLLLPVFTTLLLVPTTRALILGRVALSNLAGRLAAVVLVSGLCLLMGVFTFFKSTVHLGTRTFFLLCLGVGLTVGSGVMLVGNDTPTPVLTLLFNNGYFITSVLFFQYRLTFPRFLGKKPRWWLSLLYFSFVPGVMTLLLAPGSLMTKVFMGYAAAVALAGVVIGWAVYFHWDRPNYRQRLRVGSAGLTLAIVTILTGYLIPALTGWYDALFPAWIAVALVVLAPAGWFIPQNFSKLYRVDRLFHALGAFLVATFIIAVIVGSYFTWLFPLLSPNGPVRVFVTGALVLAVGVGFYQLWRLVRRGLDKLIYRGQEQDPQLAAKASQMLAGALSRRELNQVLTRDIPGWMHLSGGQLWFGGTDNAPTRKGEGGSLDFPLTFQAKVRAIWSVLPPQDGHPFTSEDEAVLGTIAKQAEVALRNVLLVETLRRQLDEIGAAQDLLAQAQHQMIRSRENERSRLARDLHDGPVQSLVALNLALGLLDPVEADNAEKIASALIEIRTALKDLIAELREVCAELRPPLLDTLGLGSALDALAVAWGEENGITVTTEIEADEEMLCRLSDETAVNLYRIVQEALHNIGKHARAGHVMVRMQCHESNLELVLIDDGAGFAVPETFRDLTQAGHFGLVGMRERVNLIGGKWNLTSMTGQGTCITIDLPIDK